MLAGFDRAVRAAGVAGEIPEGDDLNSVSGEIYAGIARRLALPDPPDGWVCPGEIAAIAAGAAIGDAGLALGREVDLMAKQTNPDVITSMTFFEFSLSVIFAFPPR